LIDVSHLLGVTGNLKEPFSWPFEIVSSSSDPFSS